MPNTIQPKQEPADAEAQEQSNYHVLLLPGHDVTQKVDFTGIHPSSAPVIWNNMIDLIAAADKAVTSGGGFAHRKVKRHQHQWTEMNP